MHALYTKRRVIHSRNVCFVAFFLVVPRHISLSPVHFCTHSKNFFHFKFARKAKQQQQQQCPIHSGHLYSFGSSCLRFVWSSRRKDLELVIVYMYMYTYIYNVALYTCGPHPVLLVGKRDAREGKRTSECDVTTMTRRTVVPSDTGKGQWERVAMNTEGFAEVDTVESCVRLKSESWRRSVHAVYASSDVHRERKRKAYSYISTNVVCRFSSDTERLFCSISIKYGRRHWCAAVVLLSGYHVMPICKRGAPVYLQDGKALIVISTHTR